MSPTCGAHITGRRWSDTPPLESITPECIAYWTARMNAARHPALRARYADMVWDLSQKATGTKPPIDAARIAIDGYSEALTAYPEMSSHSWGRHSEANHRFSLVNK